MTFEEWLALGQENKWVEGFCYTHDTPPMDEDERAQDEEGGDPCIPVLRVWMPA